MIKVSKRNKIIYWISTLWLALGMISTGIVQMLRIESETEFILKLGYPGYVLPLLGLWKILGVIAIFLPKFPVLKEWAYAGFFFTMTGAMYSHIVSGHGIAELGGPLLLLVLTFVSWYFRPAEKKVTELVNQRAV